MALRMCETRTDLVREGLYAVSPLPHIHKNNAPEVGVRATEVD